MTDLEHELAQFCGSETFYRHGINRAIIYTEGVHYLAEKAGAYWLIDEIAIGQTRPQVKGEEFQVWKLERHGDNAPHSATLSVDDGNGRIVFEKPIPYTDFPLPEIQLYCENSTICLPRER